MRRHRCFDHLFAELSVAANALVPRYALWLRIHELGGDPARLDREGLHRFLDEHLDAFLAEHDLRLGRRERRRLVARLRGFDPSRPTPEEIVSRILPPGP